METPIVQSILDESIYNNIVRKHDVYAPIIDKALHIVEEFIINRQLILVGGMAIDMALRKKGGHIYEDDAVPDYDFLSPQFHRDAYDLGEILSNEFTNISIINARHPSTMRVRINFISVADITYIPSNIYEKIPTLSYGKMRIIAPSFQYIDQHRSLSLPYEDPPMETILQRWEKDMKRHDLLYASYPLEINPKLQFNAFLQYEFDTSILDGQCLGGYPAILYWWQHASKLGFNYDDTYQLMDGILFSESKISLRIPSECVFTIISDDLWKLIPKLKSSLVKSTKLGGKVKKRGSASLSKQKDAKTKENEKKKEKDTKNGWFNAILDKFSRCVRLNNFEVLDNNGNLVCATKWNLTHIVNLQHIMGYLMVLYFWSSENMHIWSYLYIICREIITWASKQYEDTSDEKYMVFLPNTEVYGKHNWSDVYMIYREEFKIKLEEMSKPINLNKPKHAYPEKGQKIDEKLYSFDPSKSAIYQFDGKKVDTFKPIVLLE